ncbi:MAG TPA: hypothetical protein VIR33_01920, partial [Thermopolyspora sp.]
AGLTKQEKALAQQLIAGKKVYEDWSRSLEKVTFKPITDGIKLAASLLPMMTPLVKAASKGLSDLVADARKGFQDPFWTRFRDDLAREIPGAITTLGHVAGNTFTAFAGVLDAVLPHSAALLGSLETLSAKAATWAVGLKGSPEFISFVSYVQANGPIVVQTLSDLATTAGNLVRAVAPFGSLSLSGLSLLARLTAGMDPGQLQAIALAVGAIYAAIKSGQAVSAAAKALGDFKTEISDAAGAAEGGKGKLSAFAGLLGAGGPWGIAIGAGVAALGLFASRQQEAEQRVRDLTSAIQADSGALGTHTRAVVADQLEQEGLLKTAKDAGVNLGTLTSAILGNKDAYAEVSGQLDAVIKARESASRSLFNFSRDTLKQRDAAFELRAALKGESGAVVESVEAARRKAEADGTAATSSQTAGQAIAGMGGKAAVAAGQVGGLSERVRGLVSANTSAITSEIGYQAAVDQATAAVKNNGVGLDTNTLKGRNNLSALVDLATKATDYRQSLVDQGQPLSSVNALLQTQREKFIAVAEKMGATKTVAKKYADQLGLIPKSVTTKVELDVKQAQSTWDAFTGKLQAFTVKIPVTIAAPKQAAGGILGFAAGGIEAYAAGGVRQAARSAGPKITTRPTVLYGEGNGPEA